MLHQWFFSDICLYVIIYRIINNMPLGLRTILLGESTSTNGCKFPTTIVSTYFVWLPKETHDTTVWSTRRRNGHRVFARIHQQQKVLADKKLAVRQKHHEREDVDCEVENASCQVLPDHHVDQDDPGG